MILLLSCRCAEISRLLIFVILAGFVWEALPVLSVHAETTIVPLTSVRQRYDSNVFRRPKQLLQPGTQADDFVTTVGVGLELLHKTRDMEADVKVGGAYSVFVENTQRNFIAATLQGHVGLDHWIDQYVRGAKLRIRENLRYTPEQPSLIRGARDLPIDDSLLSGTQGFRATTIYSTTDARGEYPVSRDLSVEGGYTFGIQRIESVQGGDIAGGPQRVDTFFDTRVHTWQGGPRYKLTRNDSVAALYRQSFITQSRSEGGGREFSHNIISLAGDYTKEFQEWGFSFRGGVTFVEPAGKSFPTATLQVTTQPERDTVVYLNLSREGRPSFFLVGGVTISNAARVGISHKIYERLVLDGTFGYAYNELVSDTDRIYRNLTATSTLSYKLTRTITGEIFYLYQNIDSDTSSIQFQYSRSQVGVMLSAAWK